MTPIHRRTFLTRSGLSLGGAALGGLLARDGLAAAVAAGALQPLHHPPKAKAVIFLCLAGGPSHLETFDHKPLLAKLESYKELPADQTLARLQLEKASAPSY